MSIRRSRSKTCPKWSNRPSRRNIQSLCLPRSTKFSRKAKWPRISTRASDPRIRRRLPSLFRPKEHKTTSTKTSSQWAAGVEYATTLLSTIDRDRPRGAAGDDRWRGHAAPRGGRLLRRPDEEPEKEAQETQ